MIKRSLTTSIVKLKCPKCRQGNLFIENGLFQFKNILKMPDHCSVCQQKFEIEPGFWIGALWTSYPILIAIEVPFLLLALLSETINPWLSFGCMLIAFILFYPLMLRLGRSLWIHISIRFDGKRY